MPELPDIVVYIEAMKRRIQGQTLKTVRVMHPFLVRTVGTGSGSLKPHFTQQCRNAIKAILFCVQGRF